MKKFILSLFLTFLFIQPSLALDLSNFFCLDSQSIAERQIKKVLKSQVKYANKENFKKFISTYDKDYINSDGFNLEIYSELIKDIWNNYENIEYAIDIKDIKISGNTASVDLIETSFAELPVNKAYNGELKSLSESTYKLHKTNNGWKVISDSVQDEITTMLYGEAKNLDIKLTVPNTIGAGVDYSAILEFTPPSETMAIASIAADIVEYPQKPTKEVFRAMPEDNILERLFTSNNQSSNEYVAASIGLTKTSVCNMGVNLNLTGFGYAIRRVNVIPDKNGASDVKDK